MKRIIGLITAGIVTCVAAVSVMAPGAYASNLIADEVCGKSPDSIVCGKKDQGQKEVNSTVKTIINTLLFIVGIISVIMIIIGGIRYATSNGDANQVTGAKNTILYAIVGLVVAIFAYAIVQFVYTQVTKNSTSPGGSSGGAAAGSSSTSSDGSDSNGIQ